MWVTLKHGVPQLGTPLVYLFGVPLKKCRPEQITVKELKADIRR